MKRSRELFVKVVKDKGVNILESFEQECDEYFDSHSDDKLKIKISLINVCESSLSKQRNWA